MKTDNTTREPEKSATDNCQPVTPCPLLFPSFTVTRRQQKRYMEAARAVAADTYLPQAYRRGGCPPPLVADRSRYVPAAVPLPLSSGYAEFLSHPVLRTDIVTGETATYASGAEAARLNHRSPDLLYRQMTEPRAQRRYIFKTIAASDCMGWDEETKSYKPKRHGQDRNYRG